MSNTIQSTPNYNYFNSYQKTNEPITIESLSEDLKEYNIKNNKDVMFIDMLEKISINLTMEEKLSISNDGNKLLKKLEDEISKLNGHNSYVENNSDNSGKSKDLDSELSELKSKLLKETDENKILELQMKIFELETLMITRLG